MDERRFRRMVDDLSEAVALYDEEEIFPALGVIAERFGWELAKRDPGPPEENDESWTAPVCVDPNCACQRIGRPDHFTRVLDAISNANSGFDRVIDLTGRIR